MNIASNLVSIETENTFSGIRLIIRENFDKKSNLFVDVVFSLDDLNDFSSIGRKIEELGQAMQLYADQKDKK